MKQSKIILEVLLGNAILAFAIAVFILPNQTICGGVTGLSILLQHYFHMDLSLSVLLLNILLFLAGALVLGKKFAMTTLSALLSSLHFLRCFKVYQT